ncbi:MAG: S-layer homology domain-containing protein [Clostridia bacterium]|nr:S-layer homology domain-containing protein [Clostridia bacterium]
MKKITYLLLAAVLFLNLYFSAVYAEIVNEIAYPEYKEDILPLTKNIGFDKNGNPHGLSKNNKINMNCERTNSNSVRGMFYCFDISDIDTYSLEKADFNLAYTKSGTVNIYSVEVTDELLNSIDSTSDAFGYAYVQQENGSLEVDADLFELWKKQYDSSAHKVIKEGLVLPEGESSVSVDVTDIIKNSKENKILLLVKGGDNNAVVRGVGINDTQIHIKLSYTDKSEISGDLWRETVNVDTVYYDGNGSGSVSKNSAQINMNSSNNRSGFFMADLSKYTGKSDNIKAVRLNVGVKANSNLTQLIARNQKYENNITLENYKALINTVGRNALGVYSVPDAGERMSIDVTRAAAEALAGDGKMNILLMPTSGSGSFCGAGDADNAPYIEIYLDRTVLPETINASVLGKDIKWNENDEDGVSDISVNDTIILDFGMKMNEESLGNIVVRDDKKDINADINIYSDKVEISSDYFESGKEYSIVLENVKSEYDWPLDTRILKFKTRSFNVNDVDFGYTNIKDISINAVPVVEKITFTFSENTDKNGDFIISDSNGKNVVKNIIWNDDGNKAVAEVEFLPETAYTISVENVTVGVNKNDAYSLSVITEKEGITEMRYNTDEIITAGSVKAVDVPIDVSNIALVFNVPITPEMVEKENFKFEDSMRNEIPFRTEFYDKNTCIFIPNEILKTYKEYTILYTGFTNEVKCSFVTERVFETLDLSDSVTVYDSDEANEITVKAKGVYQDGVISEENIMPITVTENGETVALADKSGIRTIDVSYLNTRDNSTAGKKLLVFVYKTKNNNVYFTENNFDETGKSSLSISGKAMDTSLENAISLADKMIKADVAEVWFYDNGGDISAKIIADNGMNIQISNSGYSALSTVKRTNGWHQAVFDCTNDETNIYIDGESVFHEKTESQIKYLSVMDVNNIVYDNFRLYNIEGSKPEYNEEYGVRLSKNENTVTASWGKYFDADADEENGSVYQWSSGGRIIETGSADGKTTVSISTTSVSGNSVTFTVTPKDKTGLAGKSLSKTLSITSGSSGGNHAGGGGSSSSGTKGSAGQMAISYQDIKTTKDFSDVSESHWAYDAINVLRDKNILSGTGENCFEPNRNVTRAEFITALLKAYDVKFVKKRDIFRDVKDYDWFGAAVTTAYDEGIAMGFDGYFNPNANITREEMTVMLVRCMEKYGGKVLDSADINFADNNQISSWSKDSIQKAYAEGIIKGRDNNMFAPKDNADRAEMATIIYNAISQRI